MRCVNTQSNKDKLSKQGFSLVEVLLAIVILAIIAGPIAKAFYTSLSTNLKSRNLMAATDFTSSIVEEFEKQTIDEIQYNLERNNIGEEDSPNRIISVGVTKEGYPSYKLEGITDYNDFLSTCKELKLKDKCLYYANFLDEDGKVHTCYFIYQVNYSKADEDRYNYLYDCIIELSTRDCVTESDEYSVYDIKVTTYKSKEKNERFSDWQCELTGSAFNKY